MRAPGSAARIRGHTSAAKYSIPSIFAIQSIDPQKTTCGASPGACQVKNSVSTPVGIAPPCPIP